MGFRDSDARMKREANEEEAYNKVENNFIYYNMRPPSVGEWEWRLMFGQVPHRKVWVDAAADAQSMALELGVSTSIDGSENFWQAFPSDRWDGPDKYPGLYEQSKYCYIRLLVVNNYYPDIDRVGRQQGARVGLHHHDVERHHGFLRKKYASLSEKEKQEFDRGLFRRPLPDGFWGVPEFLLMPVDPPYKL